jgi:hypothetical protein
MIVFVGIMTRRNRRHGKNHSDERKNNGDHFCDTKHAQKLRDSRGRVNMDRGF